MNAIFLKFNIYDRNLKIFFHSSKPYLMSHYCRLDYMGAKVTHQPCPRVARGWQRGSLNRYWQRWGTRKETQQKHDRSGRQSLRKVKGGRCVGKMKSLSKKRSYCSWSIEPPTEKVWNLKTREVNGRPLRSLVQARQQRACGICVADDP